MDDRVARRHRCRERARAEKTHRDCGKPHRCHDRRENRVDGRHVGKRRHSGETDEHDRDQKNLERRVEHDHPLQALDVPSGVDLHEVVGPYAESQDRDGDRARIAAPRPRVTGGVEPRSAQHVGRHPSELFEHRPDPAMELVRKVEPEHPRQREHQDSLERIGPRDADHAALEDVDHDDAVRDRGAAPYRNPSLGDDREHVARTLHLQNQVRHEGDEADEREDCRDRGALITVGKKLCLGDVAALSPEARDARSEKIPRK